MATLRKSFIENEKELLKSYIRHYYLPNIFLPKAQTQNEFIIGAPIELILRPECNQQCEYCYIYKYGKDLYPLHKRIDKEQTLKNIHSLLVFLIENKITIPEWDLFGGDLFYDNLIYEVFDMLLNYYASVIKTTKQIKTIDINLPTNPTYLVIDSHQTKIVNYIDKFNKFNIRLNISISTDGLYAVDAREKDETVDQDFFDKLFTFAEKAHCGFHPMIAAENIDNAVKNLSWWKSMFNKYEVGSKKQLLPPFLEVRNGNWTDDKIVKYTDFLRSLWKIRVEENGNSMETLTKYLFDIPDENKLRENGRDPLKFLSYYGEKGERFPCSLIEFLRINVADMSLPTCHRLTYPQFTGGKFILDDNNVIIDLEPINTSTWTAIRSMSPLFLPKCEYCEDRFFCMKGCLGAQYEDSGEILLPIESVCKLLKARLNTLVELYYNAGIFDIAFSNNYITSPILKDYLINKIKELGYEFNYDAK